jgi:Peroxiredoxin
MTAAQLAASPWIDGIVYAEDDDGAWLKRYGLDSGKQAMTIIASPDGHVLWKSEGRIDEKALADALGKVLVNRAPVRPVILAAGTRIGQRAPNFLFEYAAGQELTLRKIAGRPATLVFWRLSSAASIDAVRAAIASKSGAGVKPLVFAINDGDDPEIARRIAREAGQEVIVVTDPAREISTAYGITMWPTTISLDEGGVVRKIQYGRVSGGKSHA